MREEVIEKLGEKVLVFFTVVSVVLREAAKLVYRAVIFVAASLVIVFFYDYAKNTKPLMEDIAIKEKLPSAQRIVAARAKSEKATQEFEESFEKLRKERSH